MIRVAISASQSKDFLGIPSTNIYRYWMNGQCLAGEACQFSHDPSLLMGTLSVDDSSTTLGTQPQTFQLQDQFDQFPSLQTQSQKGGHSFTPPVNGQFPAFTPMSQQRGRGSYGMYNTSSRPHSRPSSRHQHRSEMQSSLSMDDPEAFPTLASMNAKRNTKHHGQRSRHGHGNLEREAPSSLADVIKMTPPAPAAKKSDLSKKIKPAGSSDSSAARKIPEPQHIPWLETGARANQQYLKHRQEAIKHGSIRNKFLQR
jgi:hypothetical protein